MDKKVGIVAQGEKLKAVLADKTKSPEAKAAAIKTFAGIFSGYMSSLASQMAQADANQRKSTDSSALPNSFSHIVMQTIFDFGGGVDIDGVKSFTDILSNNFNFFEKTTIGGNVVTILNKELGMKTNFASIATNPEAHINRIMEDSKQGAGPNSYQIEIGI